MASLPRRLIPPARLPVSRSTSSRPPIPFHTRALIPPPMNNALEPILLPLAPLGDALDAQHLRGLVQGLGLGQDRADVRQLNLFHGDQRGLRPFGGLGAQLRL